MKEIAPKYTADVIMEKPNTKAMIQTTEKVVVVGASTGGTEALKVFWRCSRIPPASSSFSICRRTSPPPSPSVWMPHLPGDG